MLTVPTRPVHPCRLSACPPHALLEGELIVECVSPESCEAWAKAIRSRSKDCLKAVYATSRRPLAPRTKCHVSKELAGRNAKDVMVEIRVAMPEMRTRHLLHPPPPPLVCAC